MTKTTETTEALSRLRELSVAELDQRLESAVRENESTERLICIYLFEIRNRRGEQAFGFSNIYDYTAERLGFSERKTRYLLHLGFRLQRLPQLTAALAEGRIGWSKASKIATVATAEDEAMWLESALTLSVRELDRRIRDGADDRGSTIRFWLTGDQAAVWQNAMEICRRLSGVELDPGRCLELIAGEFLATYAYLANQREADGAEESEAASQRAAEEAESPSLEESEVSSQVEEELCPDDETLPSPHAISYGRTWREVLARDHYACQYPGCSARSTLQVHHIEFRSRTGTRSRAASNSPSNLTVLCAFHHRMAHGGVIGITGKAPSELEWRRPELMERALRGHVRTEQEFASEPVATEDDWLLAPAPILQ